MLTELSIRDIALIPRLALRFGRGLNVLSGETGAGKSLIVGSLRLLCGDKPPPDIVRQGAERGVVEGIFELDPEGWIAAELAALGLELEDGELILRREIAASGKGRIRANGHAIPRAVLAKASDLLVDLHGQHDHQLLLHPSRQLDALDGIAGLDEARTAFGRLLAELREATAELDAAESSDRAEGERRALARFQLGELEAADPQPGEATRLLEERGRLDRAEFLRAVAARVEEALAEAEGCVRDVVADLAGEASEAATHDPAWRPVAEGLDSLAISASELARDARGLGERAVDDPERLEEVRARLRLLQDLLRKYGPTEDELFAFRDRLREEEADPEARTRRVGALRERVRGISDRLSRRGAELTRQRQAAARKLASDVEAGLADLGMKGTRFEVRVTPREAGTMVSGGATTRPAGPTGFDAVEFRIAPNRGEEMRPLRRIASGGEISRVMLAMKSVLGERRGTATMVFDEIDIGVGGRIAGRVAEALAGLATHRQVICITHLARIASRADVHLRVRKAEVDGRTVTDVDPVTGDERVREIARMLGGDDEKGVAVDHARELLEGTAP